MLDGRTEAKRTKENVKERKNEAKKRKITRKKTGRPGKSRDIDKPRKPRPGVFLGVGWGRAKRKTRKTRRWR